MTQSRHAELRPKSDDFSFSSLINHQRTWQPILPALVATLLLAGCSAETAPAPKAERPVQVQRVAYENGAAAREVCWRRPRPIRKPISASRVSGKICSRLVNVGDRVHARRCPSPSSIRRTCVFRSRVPKPNSQAAASSLTQAAADLERYTTLKARGYAAIAEYDRKKASNDEAEGRLSRARRSLDLARNQLAYADLRGRRRRRDHGDARRARSIEMSPSDKRLRRSHNAARRSCDCAAAETRLGDVRVRLSDVCDCSRDNNRSFTARTARTPLQADATTRTYAPASSPRCR